MSVNALESALTGLRIAQQQLGVISTNISNVQTPGFTRKILPQSVRAVDNVAVGVVADPIIRNVDISLSRDFWTQISAVSGLETKIKYLDKIQQFHGAPEANKAISAKIAELKNTFSSLSDDPTNASLLESAVSQAQNVAEKFNDFSQLLSQMRNDTETEMLGSVEELNNLFKQLADVNNQVQAATGQGKSTASLEDLRDNTVKKISEIIDISFFTRGDGVLVVQTKSGVELAGEVANELFFDPSNLGPDQYYPGNVNGIYLGGDPTLNPNATDILQFELGGKLGALVDLRDNTLPKYQAQLDESAYRLAQRFDSEGLRLFTDENNGIPLDTAPVPNPPGPLTPVPYIGFSSVIRVNADIIDDPSLLQQGTTGDLIQAGSNEVIRRVLEFTFGTVEYEAVEGSRDVRVSANPLGDTLQENFGLWSKNRLIGDRNIAQYVTDMNVAPGNPFNPGGAPPLIDEFTLRFYDTRIAADSGVVTLDLGTAATSYPIGSAGVGPGIGTVDNAAEQVASYINSLVWPADLNVVASVNGYGQLVIDSRGNVDIGGGTMGDAGLDFMGLNAGTYTTTDPYFDVQLGNNPSVRITIEPGDTETDLVNKIDAVPGIDTADIVIDGSGFLSFRPQRGGDIKLTGGPFTSDAAGFSTAGGLAIIAEIFGNADPIVDHEHAAFRSQNLGPGVNIRTGVITGTSIIDFNQKMVNAQTQDQVIAKSGREDEELYRSTLEKELLNQSGVNIDEELANLIVIQTAYSAAARAITTVNELFDELLKSFQ
jgi:flagellar hook-associated protein 1